MSLHTKTALVLTVALGLCAATLTALPAAAVGTTYHVALTGSDSNAGTAAAPFRHIQKCADVLIAGDTCLIGAGTYRETVTPARDGTATARITYAPEPGAAAVIDGSDLVTGWSAVSAADLSALQAADAFLVGSDFATAAGAGKIYRASVTLNSALPGNQVFVDGGMQPEAQWPYPGNNPTRPVFASAQSGTTTSLSDSALTQPAGFWTGARLTSHNWFVSETGTVTSSSVGSVTAASLPSCVGLSPNQQNLYSLSGKLEALSHAGQWFYQSSSNTLYVWTADDSNPSGHTIEAKQRALAVDLAGRSYISVAGVGVRAATIRTTSTSSHDVIDGVTARYVSHYADLTVDPGKVTAADACDVLTAGETTSGILLGGTQNTLRNSAIDFSAGNGVVISGSGNTVTGNVISGVDYLGSYAAGVNILGTGQTVTHNTVVNSGRSDINIDNKVAGTTASGHVIAYNDLSDYGNLVVDVGAIYVCCSVNLAGSVIHHNLLHDAAPFTASAPAPGIYLDLSTYNATVYDNVAWNRTTYGVVLVNPNGSTTSGNTIVNNTSGTDPKAVSLFGGTYTSSEVSNNIGDVDTMAGVTETANLAHTTSPQFTAPGSRDYSIAATSPARNAGVVRSPATDGYTDANPSIGAYQYGAPKWTAGAPQRATTIQAESFSASSGVSTHAAGTGTVLGSFDGGDWVKYSSVDFGMGRDTFAADIGSELPYSGQKVEIRIDSSSGPVIGTITVLNSGGFDTFVRESTPIALTSGVHDVYLKALGTAPGVANIDDFSFTRQSAFAEAESADVQTGTTTAAGGTGVFVGSFDAGDTIGFRALNFGAGRTSFSASVAVDPAYAGQAFQLRLDSPTGTVIGSLTVASTGSWTRFVTQSATVATTAGVHDLYLIPSGSGPGVANLDWIALD
jgi:Carbohydrate binding module (family 6)